MIIEIQENGAQLHVYTTELNEVVLGRGTEADLLVNSEEVSRLHCVVRESRGKFFVKDLKSKNGTYVYDERIGPDEFLEFIPEFPLGLGKKIKVFIRSTEPVADLEDFGSKRDRRINPSAETKVFGGTLKKELIKDKSKKKNILPLLITLLLMGLGIGGFLYWKLVLEASNELAATAVPSPAPAPVAPKVSPIPGAPAEGCIFDEEKLICEGLQLADGDYAAYAGGVLSVVAQLNRYLEAHSSDTGAIPPESQQLYLLLRMSNKVHALASKIEDLEKITIYWVSPDGQKLERSITYDVRSGPSAEEQAQALDQAFTNGTLDAFIEKYKLFYQGLDLAPTAP